MTVDVVCLLRHSSRTGPSVHPALPQGSSAPLRRNALWTHLLVVHHACLDVCCGRILLSAFLGGVFSNCSALALSCALVLHTLSVRMEIRFVDFVLCGFLVRLKPHLLCHVTLRHYAFLLLATCSRNVIVFSPACSCKVVVLVASKSAHAHILLFP